MYSKQDKSAMAYRETTTVINFHCWCSTTQIKRSVSIMFCISTLLPLPASYCSWDRCIWESAPLPRNDGSCHKKLHQNFITTYSVLSASCRAYYELPWIGIMHAPFYDSYHLSYSGAVSEDTHSYRTNSRLVWWGNFLGLNSSREGE